MEELETACSYIRVSTDKQDEYSPQAQKRLVLEYCKKNNILISNDDFFMDIGISASKQLERPEFNRMIAKCKSKEHPYDKIIVWKFSRFARNQEEAIVYKRMLRKVNVEVVSVSEPIPEGMMGELIERILEWMDEYYSINLSQEVMRGMSEKARSGGIQTRVPFGYSMDKLTKEVSIVESEAEIVRYMFKQYLSGKGYSTIAKELNDNHIYTRKGNRWDRTTIRNMLANPFYCGIIRWNYASYKSGTIEYNPPEEWIEAEGKHEPLISKEDFEKATALMNEKAIASKRVGKRDAIARKHWLSGTLTCEYCGSGMNFRNLTGNHKGNPYFICRGNMKHICPYTQHTAVPIIESMFFEGFEKAIADIDVEKISEEPLSLPEINYDNQLAELDKKEDRIKQAYRDGIDTLEEYKQNKEIIQKERERILSLSEKAHRKASDKSNKKDYIDRLTTLHKLLKNPDISIEEKSEALKQYVEKVSYSKASKHMSFYFKGL